VIVYLLAVRLIAGEVTLSHVVGGVLALGAVMSVLWRRTRPSGRTRRSD
jgi:hypothetical protein